MIFGYIVAWLLCWLFAGYLGIISWNTGMKLHNSHSREYISTGGEVAGSFALGVLMLLIGLVALLSGLVVKFNRVNRGKFNNNETFRRVFRIPS